MILDAASSRACSGASAGGPSEGSPKNHPARPSPGPHSAPPGRPSPGRAFSGWAAASGWIAAGFRAVTAPSSLTRTVFTHSYFYVKSFDLKIPTPRVNDLAGRGSATRQPLEVGLQPGSLGKRACKPEASGSGPAVWEPREEGLQAGSCGNAIARALPRAAPSTHGTGGAPDAPGTASSRRGHCHNDMNV